ncbi:hypothetical protein BC827DRAFT_1186707 [Russula dissimulans]|nr:hypothetical protein BC827DRAFT_1186707 [Russula dissimulans]
MRVTSPFRHGLRNSTAATFKIAHFHRSQLYSFPSIPSFRPLAHSTPLSPQNRPRAEDTLIALSPIGSLARPMSLFSASPPPMFVYRSVL